MAVPGAVVAWPAMGAAGNSAVAERPWIRALLLAGGVLLLAGAVFRGGGSGADSVLPLGVLAVALAAVVVIAGALRLLELPRLDRPGGIAAGAACGLVAFTGVTVTWSIAGDRSWGAFDKGLVYLAFGVVGIALAARGTRAARDGALGLAVVLGAALVWALAGKVIPSLYPDGDRANRLRSPVGYWNALALLAGAAIPLGLWLAVSLRARLARLAGALLVYVAVLSVLLTQSRAGLLAAVAVVVLWLWLEPQRVEGALIALLAAAPAVAIGAWAFTRPGLVHDGVGRAARVTDGRPFGALLLAGAAVVALLCARVPVERLASRRRRAVVRALAGAVALLLAVGVVSLVVAVGNPATWVAGQVSGRGGEVVNDPTRLGTLSTNNRIAWWGEAWRIFEAHPALGTGARTFEMARKRYRADARSVSEPHSVPLQLLADTGIVGFALGAVFAAATALAARAALRRLAGAERAAACALVALPAAWALHALVDYDLDFLSVTGPALLVTGLLLGLRRPPASLPRGWLPLALVAALAATVVAALAAPDLARRGVDAAYAAIDAGRVGRARDRALAARRLDPLSPEPLAALAAAESAARNDRAAIAYLAAATRLQPENPDTWYELGLAYQALGDQCQGYAALNRSYTLDPKSLHWTPGGELDVARAAVNAGACRHP